MQTVGKGEERRCNTNLPAEIGRGKGCGEPARTAKSQDSRSLYYIVREISLWHFDIHHSNMNKRCTLHFKIGIMQNDWWTALAERTH